MDERPSPPPEGELIKEAQKAMALSARKAAKLADMSDSRWRQIVSGYQIVSGRYIPVEGRAETLARMARAVGLTPDKLAKARPDAAAELRTLMSRPGPVPTTRAELKEFLAELADKQADLSERTRQALNWLEETEKQEARDRDAD